MSANNFHEKTWINSRHGNLEKANCLEKIERYQWNRLFKLPEKTTNNEKQVNRNVNRNIFNFDNRLYKDNNNNKQ